MERKDTDIRYKWDIESMYSSDEDWESDLSLAAEKAEELESYRGRVGESAAGLADLLELSDAIDLLFERVYVYSRMKLDEDNRISAQQAMYNKALSAAAALAAKMSFITPELIAVPEEKIMSFLEEEPRLEQYRHLLLDSIRQKAHVLSKQEENILAQLGEVLGSPDQIFTMLNDADMDLGTIKDENGNDTKLTHGNYIKFMRSRNRDVRKAAFESCYNSYKNLINTIAANYSANVKTDVITARLRKYGSAREAALSSGNIDVSVYDNLVKEVRGSLPVMHRYISLRKELLGVDELKMYDVYVPVVKAADRDIPFEDALYIARKGLAPLGEEYLEVFDKGCSERWMDVYENDGKTSGAYSFGSYDSKPFVLLNYANTLEDVFTIVHEMGHSINSYYTRKTQPVTYGGHSIFTAEVASTVNETLLMRHLLENETDVEMKKYILNMYLEAFRTTLFRQTMFAEFEQIAHSYVESGGSLTAEWMCEQYDKLNSDYFGPALSHDDLIRYEWARIPHFYRSFYVYQYATGYSAANAIADRILTEGAPARDDYIRFLATGSSDYPVELLKTAGVDMSSPAPVKRAMEMFASLVDQFEDLLKK